MSATAAISGYNTVLKKGSTAIVEAQNLDGPNMQRDWIDATHLTSDNQAKEFIAGLIESGEVTGTLNWIPGDTTHGQMYTDFFAGTKDTYSIVFPDALAHTFTFTAGVATISPAASKESALSAQFSLKISGIVSITHS